MYARLGDAIYIHGAPASRMLRRAGDGHDVCLTVTLLDGLVMALSAFNHFGELPFGDGVWTRLGSVGPEEKMNRLPRARGARLQRAVGGRETANRKRARCDSRAAPAFG
ncbi:MAG: pyridoxamine 5'-phosphate oxidase family protein [Candidatus Dormibacteraeota bacterium]|nr:pyridoxamine 5'-phosphate oxidase family protein [Candidatus Dormibacteraeota bacterium]